MAANQVITVPGKWILAGEHAVVRGYPAVALPHSDYHLTLRFAQEATSTDLSVWPTVLSELLTELISQLERKCEVPHREERGSLFLDSTIPLQAGFGSSAALCTAITRWFIARHGLDNERVTALATELENHFHGKSSGLDVATVSTASPILFRRGEKPRVLEVRRRPRFTFVDTELRSSTRECINLVEQLAERDPALAGSLDVKMGGCAETAAAALVEYASTPKAALEKLANAMNDAQNCFRAWGLVPDEVADLEKAERERGALAVKLTGAGNGGFLVALWPD